MSRPGISFYDIYLNSLVFYRRILASHRIWTGWQVLTRLVAIIDMLMPVLLMAIGYCVVANVSSSLQEDNLEKAGAKWNLFFSEVAKCADESWNQYGTIFNIIAGLISAQVWFTVQLISATSMCADPRLSFRQTYNWYWRNMTLIFIWVFLSGYVAFGTSLGCGYLVAYCLIRCGYSFIVFKFLKQLMAKILKDHMYEVCTLTCA